MKRKNRIPFLEIHKPRIPKFEGAELIFFVSYTVYLVYMILSVSFFYRYIASVWKPVFVLCIGLLGLYELVRNGLTMKNILTVGVIILLFVNIVRVGQGVSQNAVAAVLFYMFCARKISFRKISRITIWISGFLLAVIVISSYAGIIPNYVGEGDRRREYLGFLYALYGPSLMSNITCLWVYRKKEKLTVPGALVLAVINYLLFRKTDARLCFLLTMMTLFFGLLLRKHGSFVLRRKLICYVMVFSFILACALSFALTLNYQPSVSWMAKMNSIFGSRLSLGKESLTSIGVSPFGNPGIKWVGNGLNMYGEKSTDTYLYVDSYYIQVTQRFGYVFMGLILLVSTLAAYRAYKRKDIYMLSVLFLLAVRFMIDDLYMYLHYNTIWLAAGMLVFSGGTNKAAGKGSGLDVLTGTA